MIFITIPATPDDGKNPRKRRSRDISLVEVNKIGRGGRDGEERERQRDEDVNDRKVNKKAHINANMTR